MGNKPPKGGFEAFDVDNSLAVWLEARGYVTAHVGKYMNGYAGEDEYEEGERGHDRRSARLDRVVHGRRQGPERLQLPPERERSRRRLRGDRSRVQAGRLHQPRRAAHRRAHRRRLAALPPARLHGSPRRRPESEPAAPAGLRRVRETGSSSRERLRLPSPAPARFVQRARRLRQAPGHPGDRPDRRRGVRQHHGALPLPPRVAPLGRRGRRGGHGRASRPGRSRRHVRDLHLRQRVLPRRAPHPDREEQGL